MLPRELAVLIAISAALGSGLATVLIVLLEGTPAQAWPSAVFSGVCYLAMIFVAAWRLWSIATTELSRNAT